MTDQEIIFVIPERAIYSALPATEQVLNVEVRCTAKMGGRKLVSGIKQEQNQSIPVHDAVWCACGTLRGQLHPSKERKLGII